MRSVSRTRSYSASSDDNALNRQSSVRSKTGKEGGGEFLSALTDHLSHMSTEDIPLAAHPSPLPTRRRLASPVHQLPDDAFVGTEDVCAEREREGGREKGREGGREGGRELSLRFLKVSGRL